MSHSKNRQKRSSVELLWFVLQQQSSEHRGVSLCLSLQTVSGTVGKPLFKAPVNLSCFLQQNSPKTGKMQRHIYEKENAEKQGTSSVLIHNFRLIREQRGMMQLLF